LRGETFVTRKITRAVAEIVLGLKNKLWLGNLDSKRDWGHAKDYVEAMWRILQQPTAEDYVIATGISTSVREFAKMSFSYAGIEIDFAGEGVNEKGFVVNVNNPDCKLKKGDIVLEIDKRYFRPAEVEYLLGDATKAKEKLGWTPSYSVQETAKEMVEADIEHFKKELVLKQSGYKTPNRFE